MNKKNNFNKKKYISPKWFFHNIILNEFIYFLFSVMFIFIVI